MEKDHRKNRLFEVMGRLDKTFKPTLNENMGDDMDNLTETPQNLDQLPPQIGHTIYKQVMDLITELVPEDVNNELWTDMKNKAVPFYEKIFDTLKSAFYEQYGDSLNTNAGAAPDEMSENDNEITITDTARATGGHTLTIYFHFSDGNHVKSKPDGNGVQGSGEPYETLVSQWFQNEMNENDVDKMIQNINPNG